MRSRVVAPLVLCLLLAGAATAQTRLMPVGDSITQGGQGFAAYRYPLYFDLLAAGYDVDFVGTQSALDGGGLPNPASYPSYLTTFDRDHEGYWGWRTDQVESVIQSAAQLHQPEIVLIHLGTNDIGQNGAAGVTAADQNLRDIITLMRLEVPTATFLLARVIPIGPSSGYGANAGQVGPLNAVIDSVVLAMDTPASPVIGVDPNAGFDLVTMMQGDALHPNEAGEQHMADAWFATLAPLLPPGNPPPLVDLSAPLPGASFVEPATLSLEATASDPNGSVVAVRFYADGQLLGSDTVAPYAFEWTPVAAGNYTLTAEAEDDGGAVRSSDPVAISVVPFGSPVPVSVINPSFETPAVPDFDLETNSAAIPGWDFAGTANTFVGLFNPPADSYPTAGGQGTPTGADGAQVAFLFNNGGPAESVSAVQALGETLEAGRSYTLTVAIGRFDPSQPYVPSTFGGYTVELLAGSTVIASDTDTQDPPQGEFRDAVAVASAASIPPGLVGQPLSIRLGISDNVAARSTHFDDVRLTWVAPPVVPMLGPWGGVALALGLLALARVRR